MVVNLIYESLRRYTLLIRVSEYFHYRRHHEIHELDHANQRENKQKHNHSLLTLCQIVVIHFTLYVTFVTFLFLVLADSHSLVSGHHPVINKLADSRIHMIIVSYHRHQLIIRHQLNKLALVLRHVQDLLIHKSPFGYQILSHLHSVVISRRVKHRRPVAAIHRVDIGSSLYQHLADLQTVRRIQQRSVSSIRINSIDIRTPLNKGLGEIDVLTHQRTEQVGHFQYYIRLFQP